VVSGRRRKVVVFALAAPALPVCSLTRITPFRRSTRESVDQAAAALVLSRSSHSLAAVRPSPPSACFPFIARSPPRTPCPTVQYGTLEKRRQRLYNHTTVPFFYRLKSKFFQQFFIFDNFNDYTVTHYKLNLKK